MSFESISVPSIQRVYYGDNYNRHKQLKDDLLEFLENHEDVQQRKTNVKATATDWNMKIESRELNLFKDRILDFFLSIPFDSGACFGPYQDSRNFHMLDCWGNIYRKGDYTVDHIHLPSHYSWVYFLKSKPNYSPLLFDYLDQKKRRIKSFKVLPIESRIVLFPSCLHHRVPVHIHDETRITISGNIE
tara:strand:+ start:204 stop:767 length:564 start_codon:yes stop_codon:yes gene_type:complete